MDERLEHAYEKVINRHYSAVKAEITLDHEDHWRLEKKCKQLWIEYEEAEAEFKALLHRCTIGEKT